MKILYLSKAIIPSRTANSIHVMKMCQAFTRIGHSVSLCNIHEKGVGRAAYRQAHQFYNIQSDFRLLEVLQLPVQGNRLRYLLSNFLHVPKLLKCLANVRPDLVYGRDLVSVCIAALAGYRVIFESHFPVWHGKLEAMVFTILLKKTKFKKLVVISQALKLSYLNHYPDLKDEKILVAPDGADPVEDIAGEKQWSKEGDVLHVGYVGHLYDGKGVEVIEAIAPLMKHIHFHIIGGLEQDIKRWKKRITSSNVHFHGFISQKALPDYIQSLDICLLPNQNTIVGFGGDSSATIKNISQFTSPLKMFEYMAHGKAIVASDLPVLKEVLNEDIAILVQPDDYSGWVKAIDSLADQEKREKIGERAQRTFLQNYSWQKRADVILKSLCSHNPHTHQ